MTSTEEAIALTPREYQTYEILHRAFPGYVSLEAMALEMVGTDDRSALLVVRVHIKRLRYKIGGARIVTVWGWGYQLVEPANVERTGRVFRGAK